MNGIRKGDNPVLRFVIVHVGSKTGPSNLLMFQTKLKSGDYHNKMNFENFMTLVEEMLLPIFFPKGLIPFDNIAPFHSTQKISLWCRRTDTCM
jgi:hypothetical protein